MKPRLSRSRSFLIRRAPPFAGLCVIVLGLSGCSTPRAHEPNKEVQPAPTAQEVQPTPPVSELPPIQQLPEVSEQDPITEADIYALDSVYEPVRSVHRELVRAGKISEATQRLLDVVPEAQRTAVHNLYLGNLLYPVDRKQSYTLHLEAFRQKPESSLTNLEAAMELQRAGKAKEACSLYERFLKRNTKGKPIHALQAHCLLVIGDLQRAVEAWESAEHPRRHVAIDEAISEVFGLENPWSVRGRLIEKIGGKKPGEALGELIRHDVVWSINWWNEKPAFDVAREDLANFGPKVGPEVREGLALLIEAAENVEQPSDELKKRLNAQLQQRAASLPTHVLRGLVAHGLRGQMLSPENAVAWVLPTMEKRAFSEAGTVEDVEFLAAVAQGHDEKLLEKADSHCWSRFKERVCAESLFVQKANAGRLSANDPEFKAALETHPDSSALYFIALQLAPQDKASQQEALRRLIMADFHNLVMSNELHGNYSSYGISGLFRLLAESLTPE